MVARCLSREYRYYCAHRAELLFHHLNKYVLIKGKELVGIFDNQEKAYVAGLARFGNVPMLIQRVQVDDSPAVISTNFA